MHAFSLRTLNAPPLFGQQKKRRAAHSGGAKVLQGTIVFLKTALAIPLLSRHSI